MYIPGKLVTFVLLSTRCSIKWYVQVWIYNGRKYVLCIYGISVWSKKDNITFSQDQNNFRLRICMYSPYINPEIYPKLILFTKLLFWYWEWRMIKCIVNSKMRKLTILHRIHKKVNQRPTTQVLIFFLHTSSFNIYDCPGETEDSMMHKLWEWETVSVLFLRWSLVLSSLYPINSATEFPYNLP